MPSETANSNGVKDEIELVGLGPENSNGSAMMERTDAEGYACNGDGTYLGAGCRHNEYAVRGVMACGAGEKVLDECAVELEHIRKTYNLEGRDEQVVALKEINISHESEIVALLLSCWVCLDVQTVSHHERRVPDTPRAFRWRQDDSVKHDRVH